ncbi:Phycobilisome degradation protein NblA [Nostoc flagelliforme CCNUN1]|uniref:Phycobilisome degradation protein NblA n=1 Tax=Nostoc flagelliforme CCNUN1 TaxID=2038116 RepID=A0A2K8SZX4_9NOSO|nr:Phycobilisome degradation protein NblA [Nostoc flagelliforme CCNUN1]
MWAMCQTLVIFRNTEEQMLDRYQSNYDPIWTSVSDINFTRCFFGVNYEPTNETILGTAIQHLLICYSGAKYEPRSS